MPKMTHATLSVQLKSLVDSGLVERKQYESIPPKVEYSLTAIGRKFHPVIEALKNWGQDYIEYLKEDKIRPCLLYTSSYLHPDTV